MLTSGPFTAYVRMMLTDIKIFSSSQVPRSSYSDKTSLYPRVVGVTVVTRRKSPRLYFTTDGGRGWVESGRWTVGIIEADERGRRVPGGGKCKIQSHFVGTIRTVRAAFRINIIANYLLNN